MVVVLNLNTAPPQATPNLQPQCPRYYKSKLKASKPDAKKTAMQKQLHAKIIALSVVVVLVLKLCTGPPKPPQTASREVQEPFKFKSKLNASKLNV